LYKNGGATDDDILLARLDANHKEMMAKIDAEMEANRNAWRKERTACQETTETCLECKEPTSADMKACQETTACQ
jgi:hypothetical protein